MAFTLKSLFVRDGDGEAVRAAYGAIVEQARAPGFYRALGVPDSAEGRFAMLALHGFLAMDRLGREAGQRDFSQALFDAMFADMDRNLREMGVGDLSVGKKVTGLAQSFYAMAADCRAGLTAGDGGAALAGALRHYVWRDAEPPPGAGQALADYALASAALLAGQDAAEIGRGRIAFAPPPGGEKTSREEGER